MWTEKKSIFLSKVFVIIFLLAVITCMILAPGIIDWVISSSYSARLAGKIPFLLTTYAGGVAAAALLGFLYVLLRRIGAGRVFIEENTASLRYISWFCFIGAAISAASAIYYLPWIAVGIAAGFMGLVARVIKNVFAGAVALQNDAELTI